jgi:hypothetical protein
MKSLGKTIQIYCPQGEPRGIRIAEITTRIVQAVAIPRAKLQDAIRRPEVSSVGVYFLFGDADGDAMHRVYIGEADDCAARLKQHHKREDFWNLAVCIISRTGSFTKAHGRLLDYMAIDRATKAGRYKLVNGNSGSFPTVPEWMQADVDEVFETADVLLSTLGYPVFDPPSGTTRLDPASVFLCTRGGSNAKGVYNEEGFVVLADSLARREITASAHEGLERRRQELIADGALEPTKLGLRFTRDTAFPSPSAAAAIVTGGSANGWVEWKRADGKTLDEVVRRDGE